MKEKFLKVAAIYEANASGKSNLYMAMSLFQGIIKESLDLFYDEHSRAQLIYTTHDTTLIDKKFYKLVEELKQYYEQ